MRKTITIIVCTATYCLLTAISVASFVIGTENRDDTCQSVDTNDLELHEWLIGAGVAGILSSMLIMFLGVKLFLNIDDPMIYDKIELLSLPHQYFNAFYSILGASILYQKNIECLNEGTALGIMSQIMICVYWFSIIGHIYIIKKKYLNNN